MPTVASAIFRQLAHPHTPSAVRLNRRWQAFSAFSVAFPKMPSSVLVEYPSAFSASCRINTYVLRLPRRRVG